MARFAWLRRYAVLAAQEAAQTEVVLKIAGLAAGTVSEVELAEWLAARSVRARGGAGG